MLLALLTVFRREMSCNRVYSDEEEVSGSESRRGRLISCSGDLDSNCRLERKRSSSALPSSTARRRHNILEGAKGSEESGGGVDDPTEELLEAAGRFCSGGPLLAMALAVFDHLVFTSFLSSLILSAKTSNEVDSGTFQFQEGGMNIENRNKNQLRQEVRVYNVAWDAATNYFDSIAKMFNTDADKSANSESAITSRSKSTSNLDGLHNGETSRSVLRDIMALARRRKKIGSDIMLFPLDAHISICSYLAPRDLLSFTCTCRSARDMLDDCEAFIGRKSPSRGSRSGKNNVNNEASLIWKMLFLRDYSWVISEWKIGQDAFRRSVNSYQNQGLLQRDIGGIDFTTEENRDCGLVMHHLLPLLMKDNKNEVSASASSGNCNGDTITATKDITSPASMKEFYFTFAETWLEYTIAGCNTTETCLVGLHGHVFDISNFVEQHPGSTETLLLQAGLDATVFFESMGHSLGARKLASSMCAVINRETIRWDSHLDSSQFPALHSSWGLMKPSNHEVRNKMIPGFLIPRKRSRPRNLGGLQRIRSRLMEEKARELDRATRWGLLEMGNHGMFGGVHVYYDPFCSTWKWWYTDLEFHPVFRERSDA